MNRDEKKALKDLDNHSKCLCCGHMPPRRTEEHHDYRRGQYILVEHYRGSWTWAAFSQAGDQAISAVESSKKDARMAARFFARNGRFRLWQGSDANGRWV